MKKIDSYSKKSAWMSSDYFWKRALAVYGYCVAGAVIVWIVVFGVIMGFNVVFALLTVMSVFFGK